MAKRSKEPRFGVILDDLTPEQKQAIESNTGAVVYVVVNDSKAFNSNILAGDALTAINGRPVRNSSHAVKLLERIPEDAPSVAFTIIRRGVERSIVVKL